MPSSETRRLQRQKVEGLAREALAGMFVALTGEPPRTLRTYGQGDALMLLLRFDPQLVGGGDDPEAEARMDTSLMAMLELIADVVSARSGCEVVPGNLSVCAHTGLAVFAMRLAGEEAERRCLRLAGDRRGGALPVEGLRLAS